MLTTLLISLTTLAVISCCGVGWFARQAEQVNTRVVNLEAHSTSSSWDLEEAQREVLSLTTLYRHDLDELSHSLGNASMLTPSPLVQESLDRVRGSRSLLESLPGECCLNWVAAEVLSPAGIILNGPMVMVGCCEENVKRILKGLLFWLTVNPNRVVVGILVPDSRTATLEILFKQPCDLPTNLMSVWREQVTRCRGTITQFQWGDNGRGLS